MAGVLQHLRSSTLDKRPNPASMVDGQMAINYASGAPGMFFKDSNGSLVKVGPVHVGSTAPNVSPASGGTAGNSIGEQWLDNSGGTYVFKIWDGVAWRSEAGEFVNATGDTMTGDLVMNNANVVFEGSVDDGFETTLTVVNPTADRTITLPNVTGTVVTTGDSGTVTSTMIANGTIVDADVNASAAIAGTKISPNFGSQTIQTTGIISAAGGSASAPSIAFTGDTNTGIYSPGADQLALATNGTQRLLIDSSGNINIDSNTLYVDATNNRVGVGTSSPVTDLHLSKTTGPILRVGASASVGDNASTGRIEFYGGSTAGSGPGIKAVIDTESTTASARDFDLLFKTSNDVGSGEPLERLRITAGGLVGIGDNGPDSTLTIKAAASTTPLRVSGPSSEFARIDGSGRLLVGTSTDAGGALLQVNGNRVRIATAKTPASASDTGTTGEVCWDSGYIYVCTATNTWKRAALSTW